MWDFYRLLAFALAAAALFSLACGNGSNYSSEGTAATPATATAPTGASPAATDIVGPNEGGDAPIFWRTADNFASVVAGQPYTVLFRITNGYEAEALVVSAVCTSCPDEQVASFEGRNSPPFPAGSDLPGAYYPMNMVFPLAGQWEISVSAISDHKTIPIDVNPEP